MTKKFKLQYLFIPLFIIFLVFGFVNVPLYAEEITILYTGGTHAMLYPCNCPNEPDGGVARRAALIKKLKKEYAQILLLDGGGFFAGGSRDEYSQNTQLDSRRTSLNLKAMELMHYDAVAISQEEFNFGEDFLRDRVKKTNLDFLSCNISGEGLPENLRESRIRELAGIKFGIIGVTALSAGSKSGSIKILPANSEVKRAVASLKENGADIIILLSNLGDGLDKRLIEEAAGIDVIIQSSTPANKEEEFAKVGDTLLLSSSWQGRRLGKVILTIKDKKVDGFKVEALRLSDEIADDAVMLSAVPECFSDARCKKEGFEGSCQNPGISSSRCSFIKAEKIKLLVITYRPCPGCDEDKVIDLLKKQFPGLVIKYLYYPGSKEAQKLITKLSISTLPAFLLEKRVEQERNFSNIQYLSQGEGGFYFLKPEFSGVAYFLGRQKLEGRLDLFLSLYEQNSNELLELMKGFNPELHFLAIEKEGKFEAAFGEAEIEEYLRTVCVYKYYPKELWDYLSCRSQDIQSSWWEDCLGELDYKKIKLCAKSEEGNSLLRENISLNKELKVMVGPVYLLNNQEIFTSRGIPAKEEFEKIIKTSYNEKR